MAVQGPYSEQVLDHFARPRNLGRLPDADGRGVAGDLLAGPAQITVAVRLGRDDAGEARVAAARFRAFGCSAAIASASMATVLIEGRTLAEAAALTPEAIAAALGGLPADRLYAPALAAEATRMAIADCGLRITERASGPDTRLGGGDGSRGGERAKAPSEPGLSAIRDPQSKGGTMARGYARTIEPGRRVSLAKIDPGDTGGLERGEGERRLAELDQELGELQELLYAAGQHSVLLLLQGLDTSGKDGTIKRVLREVNPAGCDVVAFKAPTERELAHDFLWRVHANVPRKGKLGVFNRSHYEDVLIVRVHNLVPEKVWRARYRQINDFERLLTDSGTLLIKCFLHISKAEQEERLIAREQDVTKAWKLAVEDWIERRSWDDYQAAYEDALTECSTDYAPWHVIPADKKWYRNLAVGQLLVDALRPHKDAWLAALNARGQRELRAIQEARGGGAIGSEP